jgi:Tol biopolymer transport system component
MFCTACATLNALPTARCAVCGASLSQIAARESDARPVAAPWFGVQAARGSIGRLIRRGLYLVPILGVLLATAHRVDGSRVRQRTLAAAYARGAEAAAVGDYLTALGAYADAAGYRDAVQRRAEVAALLTPYEDAYYNGVAALDAGQYDEAIAAFLSIVRDLPDYEDAALLLEQARTERAEELTRQADAATIAGDWLTVEQSLAALVAEGPGDPALSERLAEVRRDHAPLVFSRGGELYLIGPDGADERLLVDAVPAAWPVWSPDRSRIAFISAESITAAGEGKLYVVAGDGTGLTEVATGVRAEAWPVWSPDGSRIAYVGETAAAGEAGGVIRSIRYVDLATRNVTNVTKELIVNPYSPTWSPAGDRLALISRRMGSATLADPRYPLGQIYVITIATGKIEMVGAGQFPDARRLAWSPVGEDLLVFSRTDGTYGDGESIALLDLATGKRSFVFASSLDLSPPVWSPDGRRFAYIVAETNVHVETTAGESQMVSLGSTGGRSLVWSPDGRALMVLATGGVGESLLIPLADNAGSPAPVRIAYDRDRRLGGSPQWSPLTLAKPLGPPSVSGTASDPAV